LEKGREPPQWYQDYPYLPLGCESFVEWFWDLSSERQLGGFSVGPIPTSKIREFCGRKGFDRITEEFVVAVMRIVDSVYLQWSSEQSESSKSASPPPPSASGGWGNGERRRG